MSGFHAGDQKESVAFISVIASVVMTVARFAVGFLTGSIGVLSESVKSLLDLLTAVLTWLAVKAAARPADERHPYGHGKIETFSALIGTSLLFVAGFWIAYEAIGRLLAGGGGPVEVTWWSMAILIGAILIDAQRAYALHKAARETGSAALEADALHFSSDILSSLAVVLGLIAVSLGWSKADQIAALGVAVFIFAAGLKLTWQTVDVLLDGAPKGLASSVEAVAAEVPGVVSVCQVRVRPGGIILFAEIHVLVAAGTAIEAADAIRRAVAEAVRHRCPGIDPTVLAEAETRVAAEHEAH